MNLFEKLNRTRLRKYTALIHEDLAAAYSRDIQKWLLFSPVVGILVGLVVTAIAVVILGWIWPRLLRYDLEHHWAIVPILVAGFALTGIIMQLFTPDPDEHSTEEIICSYHEHRGKINMKPFVPKLVAAVTTVASGGSAALEGPSIYAGGAIGSWLWGQLRRFGLEPRDRRIMLISGAAAGMAAVFRAPLTGLVFALEMPYKDDLAHEALLPSLISSVVAYATLVYFMGAQPLFNFAGAPAFSRKDLLWSALLGLICGLITMAFDVAFRRARSFAIRSPLPHALKLALGGLLTGLCGLAFVTLYRGDLIPIGPNYEAVDLVLRGNHPADELIVFGILKLLATLFSIGSGGVSAIFVPLFLAGSSFGTAFAQSVVHSPSLELYAAAGMAAFIAGGYKAPLTAVVFVAEATGGHSYIIPTLVAAAVAYAVSGEASASSGQRLRETEKVQLLPKIRVREIMQKDVISVEASATLREFYESISVHDHHAVFPVCDRRQLVGTISWWSLARVPTEKWSVTTVAELADRNLSVISPDRDAREALRLLLGQRHQHMLLVTAQDGKLEGILTKRDILSVLDAPDESGADQVPG